MTVLKQLAARARLRPLAVVWVIIMVVLIVWACADCGSTHGVNRGDQDVRGTPATAAKILPPRS